jgi:hypothetical protein
VLCVFFVYRSFLLRGECVSAPHRIVPATTRYHVIQPTWLHLGAGAYHSLTAEKRREQVEVWNTNFAEQSYSGVQHTLCEFEGRLDYIHADFADAYCKGDCCRLILECYEFWIEKLVPKVLDITGLRTGDEAKFEVISGSFPNPFYCLDELKELCNVRFLGKN